MNVPRVWMLYLYIPGGTEGSEWLEWYDGAEGLDDGNPNLLAATHLYKRRRYIYLTQQLQQNYLKAVPVIALYLAKGFVI